MMDARAAVAVGLCLCGAARAANVGELFDRMDEATVTVAGGACAGVLVDAQHALTAAHCVEGQAVPLALNGRQGVLAQVAHLDPDRDVAILRLPSPVGARPLPVAGSLPQVGERVLFSGRVDRHGRDQVAQVEQLARCPSLPGVERSLFTTLQGQKGDSGAPVVDLAGRVVGLVHAGAACNIATPTAEIAPALDRVLAERHQCR